MDALGLFVKNNDIDYATLSLIGGVDWFRMSVMAEKDANKDIPGSFDIPGELIGTGHVRGGQVHVHAVVGVDYNDKHHTVAGHLEAAFISTHFVYVALTVLPKAPQSIRMVSPS